MSFLKNQYSDLNYSYYCNKYQKEVNTFSDIIELENHQKIYQGEFKRDLSYIEEHKNNLFSSLDSFGNSKTSEVTIKDFFFNGNTSRKSSNYDQKIIKSIKFQINELIKHTKNPFISMEGLTNRFNLTIEAINPEIKDLIGKSAVDTDLQKFNRCFEELFKCCQSARNLSDKVEAINSTRAKFIEKKQKQEVEKLRLQRENYLSKPKKDGRVRWKNHKQIIEEKWREASRLDINQSEMVSYVQKETVKEIGDGVPSEGPSQATILRYVGVKDD